MKQASILQFWILSTLFFLISIPILNGQTTMELEKIIKRADLIIVGEVSEISSSWNSEKTQIWTYVKIICKDKLKGENDSREITIRVLGGEVDELGMDVSGTPKFKISERIICFLQKDVGDSYAVTGWEKGKYTYEKGNWVNNFSKFPESFLTDITNTVNNQDN